MSAATVMLFWDYDTQWGGDRSRAGAGPKQWGHAEFENTERLLEIQEEFDIPSCIAVVGSAALPGERPYHDPAQVRQIHEMGHEVASHTHRHDWIPGLGTDGLMATLKDSKDALEQCIGAEVSCFVPPYNQPFDYLPGLSYSRSERKQVASDRIDLKTLCQALGQTGYRFCRVSYRPITERIKDRIRGKSLYAPSKLESIAGITCVRTNACGFHEKSMDVLDRCVKAGQICVIYGHPHSLSDPENVQRFDLFENFCRVASELRNEGKVVFKLPRELLASNGVVSNGHAV